MLAGWLAARHTQEEGVTNEWSLSDPPLTKHLGVLCVPYTDKLIQFFGHGPPDPESVCWLKMDKGRRQIKW